MPEQTVASDDGIRQLTLVNPNDEKLRHLIREQLFDGLGERDVKQLARIDARLTTHASPKAFSAQDTLGDACGGPALALALAYTSAGSRRRSGAVHDARAASLRISSREAAPCSRATCRIAATMTSAASSIEYRRR